jgi:DNA polymerase-3 subunit gamma/tau
LTEQDAAKESAALREAQQHPTVAKLLEAFPGARIVEIRDLAAIAREEGAQEVATANQTTDPIEDPEQSE